MSRFRDPAARDAAWGRYYRKHGLSPIRRAPVAMPNVFRIANYYQRRARHEAAQLVTSTLIKF